MSFQAQKKQQSNSSINRNKNAQIAAKNILEKYKKMSQKKTPFPFS